MKSKVLLTYKWNYLVVGIHWISLMAWKIFGRNLTIGWSMSYHSFHVVFVLFGNIYEQLFKFKVEIVKVGKILGCLKFGSADGPRVRGGRSAIHEVFHQRLWSAENYSADSPPMNRGRSARCIGKLRLHRWCVHYASADGPPSICGRSAKYLRTVRLR